MTDQPGFDHRHRGEALDKLTDAIHRLEDARDVLGSAAFDALPSRDEALAGDLAVLFRCLCADVNAAVAVRERARARRSGPGD